MIDTKEGEFEIVSFNVSSHTGIRKKPVDRIRFEEGKGIDGDAHSGVLHELPIGTKLEIGTALLEVSQIGKECHTACEIRTLVGDCAMPRKGIFARVLRAGEASHADRGHYRIG